MIDSHVRERMQGVLDDIRSGEFAKLWIAEMESGEAGSAAIGPKPRTSSSSRSARSCALMRREDTSAVR